MLSSEEVKVELMDSDVQAVVPDAENEDDELLKSEEKEERTMPPASEDDGVGAEKGGSKGTVLFKEQLQAVAFKVAPHWKKLASKLGYQGDEVWTEESCCLNLINVCVIKSRLNSGNVCYRSVQNLLSSHIISKNIKIKMYKTLILCCFVWVRNLVFHIKERTYCRFSVFENRVLKRIFRLKRGK
jgi:hypothetical protein